MKPIYVVRYSQIRCFTRHQFTGFSQTLGAIPVKSGDLITFKKRVMLCVCLAMIFAVPVFPQTIITVAGGGPNHMPALSAGFEPQAVALDPSGNYYIAVLGKVLKVDKDGQLTLYAGKGATSGFGGDGGPATSAGLSVSGIATDAMGNLFISDPDNESIRRVDATTGIITTVAGNRTAGFSGDGGPATAATLNNPQGIGLDAAGNLFIADYNNSRIRRVNASTQIITTVAGGASCGPGCYISGEGGPATSAELIGPMAVALDSAGNLFISDGPDSIPNYRIRRVDAATQIITTVAGNGYVGFSGDGGPATSAALNNPRSIGVDGSGNLFIADTNNHRVRRVDAATQIINTVAGNGTFGFSGDGGPAVYAELS
jgi:sugar lactone lactonase YvrE